MATAPMKALVVDSSHAMRSVLCRILSMRGLEVAEANDGSEALEVLRGMGPADLILVDWQQPGIEGLDFVLRLRQEFAYDVRVILLAQSEPGARELQSALIAGADDYLLKPFTSLQIDEKLTRAGFAWRA